MCMADEGAARGVRGREWWRGAGGACHQQDERGQGLKGNAGARDDDAATERQKA